MVKITALCTDCVQVMTNPICPSCFARHIGYWLRDKNLTTKEIREVMSELMQIIRDAEDTPADTSCIVCGAKKVNLCTYCFTNKARTVLEKNIKNNNLLSEFDEDFETIIWRI
ncbi:MAG TPA: hypothetical protein VJ438_02900 [Candidatus Nanoarchaeia archaeon]|nr:hypothetical protein [Candidatus Nanoarchaeia archaeon]